MSYTLVEIREDNNPVDWYLENPEGEVIAEYDEKPTHPVETADDIADDFSDNPKDMFLFILQRRWGFRIEQS